MYEDKLDDKTQISVRLTSRMPTMMTLFVLPLAFLHQPKDSLDGPMQEDVVEVGSQCRESCL